MSNPKHLCQKCWEKKYGPLQDTETESNIMTCEECGERNEFTILDIDKDD